MVAARVMKQTLWWWWLVSYECGKTGSVEKRGGWDSAYNSRTVQLAMMDLLPEREDEPR